MLCILKIILMTIYTYIGIVGCCQVLRLLVCFVLMRLSVINFSEMTCEDACI